MHPEYNLLQWNIQGLRSKKEEILKLVHDIKPMIVALQETMMSPSFQFRIPNFHNISKTGHFN